MERPQQTPVSREEIEEGAQQLSEILTVLFLKTHPHVPIGKGLPRPRNVAQLPPGLNLTEKGFYRKKAPMEKKKSWIHPRLISVYYIN